LPATRETEYPEAKVGAARLQGINFPIEKAGHRLWIQVAEDLYHPDVLIDDVVDLFLPRVGWVVLPFLLILLVLDVIIFRRALRPIEAASEQAAKITPRTVSSRLDLTSIPTEIRPLVMAVNAALERLEVGFRLQREFAADAAHELRTPIAVLRARLASLPPSDATQALRRDIDGMSRVVTQLLQIAELDVAQVGEDECADLHEICQEAVELLAPLAIMSRKEVGLVSADVPVWVHGNPEMLFRAVRNLGENALSHSPEGGIVDIEVHADGSVCVVDQGSGIPESERTLVVRRFWRRDRARPGSSGLGLAIVNRIVELHDGTLTIGDNAPHGTLITLGLRPMAGGVPVKAAAL
jgi:signal transduction histidine kinase